MKTTLFGVTGVVLAAVLAWTLLGRETAVFAQRASVYDPSSELIALPAQVEGGRQQVTVIDPIKRVICVYHIDTPTGAITLKSVRNISGDLQIDDFNGVNPLPRDVRAQLEHR
jgi:hypothetical protein